MNEGTWPNDKPHVIYGSAFVDSAKTLNVIGGTHIYLHKNSILWNYKGTLNIDGDYNNKVTIQGDRLEASYKDVPGQYYGVYYQEARPSLVDNVIIKNATAGIHVDSRDASFNQNTLTISNVEILNAASYGLFLFNGPKVYGENVLVHSSGVHSLLVIQGADFTFNHWNFKLLHQFPGNFRFSYSECKFQQLRDLRQQWRSIGYRHDSTGRIDVEFPFQELGYLQEQPEQSDVYKL